MFPFWGQLILVALIASTAKNAGQSPSPSTPVVSTSPSSSPSPLTQGVLIPAPLAVAPIPYSSSPTPSSEQPGEREGYLPDGSCICWRYVENRIPQYPETDSAQALEQFALQQAGFVRLTRPVPGAIVLHQPHSFRSGSANGHIEVVDAIAADGVPIIATAGDNIPRGNGDAGCPNVRRERVPQLRTAQAGVSYWKLQ